MAWKVVKQQGFPPPLKFGNKRKAWSEEAVDSWLESAVKEAEQQGIEEALDRRWHVEHTDPNMLKMMIMRLYGYHINIGSPSVHRKKKTRPGGVFRVDANGSLHDYEVRFEGMVDAVIRLFTIWAHENLPPSRIVVHDVPRQIGRSRKRCTLPKRSARR